MALQYNLARPVASAIVAHKTPGMILWRMPVGWAGNFDKDVLQQ